MNLRHELYTEQVLLQLIWNLTRHELLSTLRPALQPQLRILADPKGETTDFDRLTAEEVLRRWVNFHIKNFVSASLVQAPYRMTTALI